MAKFKSTHGRVQARYEAASVIWTLFFCCCCNEGMKSFRLCVCDGEPFLSSCYIFICEANGSLCCCPYSLILFPFWNLIAVTYAHVALGGGTNSPNTMLSDAFHQVFKGDDRIFQTGFFISSSIWLCLAFNAFSRIQAQRRTKAAEAAVESNVVGTGRI